MIESDHLLLGVALAEQTVYSSGAEVLLYRSMSEIRVTEAPTELYVSGLLSADGNQDTRELLLTVRNYIGREFEQNPDEVLRQCIATVPVAREDGAHIHTYETTSSRHPDQLRVGLTYAHWPAQNAHAVEIYIRSVEPMVVRWVRNCVSEFALQRVEI